MSDLLAARSQMAHLAGLPYHLAVVGIGMPLLMVLAEWRWRATRDPVYLELAKRWAKGTAILFAVGAVSGTVLSFELGLLWPRFMEMAGPIIGMPFSLEGFAFFTEAIFLGIYLYGRDRIPQRAHLWGRNSCRAQRRALRNFCGHRERLDEHAQRFHLRSPASSRKSIQLARC